MKINVNPVSGAINTEPCEPMAGVPCGYVIFGASGDLTLRKLLPAVFSSQYVYPQFERLGPISERTRL